MTDEYNDRYGNNTIHSANYTQRYSTQWPLTYDYIRCDVCGYINESRHQYRIKEYGISKDVECESCGKQMLIHTDEDDSFSE